MDFLENLNFKTKSVYVIYEWPPKDAWVSHEQSHDKPQFSCQLCDVVYTRKDNLKRHIKDKHHTKQPPDLIEKITTFGDSLSNEGS